MVAIGGRPIVQLAIAVLKQSITRMGGKIAVNA
jgi:hypothetical protein